jgi:hypothetical protein
MEKPMSGFLNFFATHNTLFKLFLRFGMVG